MGQGHKDKVQVVFPGRSKPKPSLLVFAGAAKVALGLTEDVPQPVQVSVVLEVAVPAAVVAAAALEPAVAVVEPAADTIAPAQPGPEPEEVLVALAPVVLVWVEALVHALVYLPAWKPSPLSAS